MARRTAAASQVLASSIYDVIRWRPLATERESASMVYYRVLRDAGVNDDKAHEPRSRAPVSDLKDELRRRGWIDNRDAQTIVRGLLTWRRVLPNIRPPGLSKQVRGLGWHRMTQSQIARQSVTPHRLARS
jgi:hypothetical protein